jgi:uncharacterized cupin superfamily protein
MQTITIRSGLSPEELESLGVNDWPIWTRAVSRFDWTYDNQETCYILEGAITVTPEGGDPVSIVAGDLVIFPQGMSCVWEVTAPVSKHYRFETG